MRNAPFKHPGRKYLSFSLCEGCGSSLPPRRALVYFQWYGFQASNHIIKALHHIYSSSKVSDNLQLFSTPTAKPCTNMNTLGSILIIWCILFWARFIFRRVQTLTHTIYWQSLWTAGAGFSFCSLAQCTVFLFRYMHDETHVVPTRMLWQAESLALEAVPEHVKDLIINV